jgi:hypothetical protein
MWRLPPSAKIKADVPKEAVTMKAILSIPVVAAKALFDLLMGYDDISEQLRAERYKAQMLMMTLYR